MEYWLVDACGFAVAAFLLVRLTAATRDLFTAAHVFSFVWAAYLAAVQVLDGGSYLPSVFTLALLFVSWWALLGGAWVVLRRPLLPGGPAPAFAARPAVILMGGLVFAQLLAIWAEAQALGIPMLSYLSRMGAPDPALRLASAYSAVDLPSYLEPWRWGYVYYVPLAVVLYRYRHISSGVMLALLTFALSSCVVRFTRAPLAQMMVVLGVAMLVVYRPSLKVAVPVVMAGAIGAVSIFILMQIKLIASDPHAAVTTSQSVAAYFGGPMKAYDILVTSGIERSGAGLYSLDAVNHILYRAGLIGEYPSLIRPYTHAPVATNLYTYLDAYTLDLGPLGALLGSFLTGLLITWLYRRVRERPTIGFLIVYCYAVYGCVMAGANNEFIRLGFVLVCGIAWLIDRALSLADVTSCWHSERAGAK